jgi:prepilin-type N-terminal cleavage/methylation domain-containing protein
LIRRGSYLGGSLTSNLNTFEFMTFQDAKRSLKLGFTLTETIITIAIVGVMASLIVSAVSNGSRDAQRIVARQQQAAIQNAINSWVMSQTRVSATSRQIKSVNEIRNTYNSQTTALGKLQSFLAPPSGIGFLDKTTADHFAEYTTNTDRLKSGALDMARQHLSLPAWTVGGFPRVDLVND